MDENISPKLAAVSHNPGPEKRGFASKVLYQSREVAVNLCSVEFPSAILCGSAVIRLTALITAEARRTAELHREDF
jgi:hypothetical protein